MSGAGRLSRKLALDGVMLALILAEFAYGLTGSTVHELLGLGLVGLFVLHGGWNWRWFVGLCKGRYRGLRLATLVINTLLLILAMLMMVSGIVNSELLFRTTGIERDWIPRALHTASAHWFLVLASIHLGLHWTQIKTEARRLSPVFLRLSPPWGVLATVVIATFGLHASLDRSLYARMIAYYSFGDWNFSESIAGFFVRYLAIVAFHASVAYYALRFGKSLRTRTAGAESLIEQG